MRITVTNPPQRLLLEEYDNEIDKYIDRASSVDGLLGVMSMGSVGAPGLSDIDLICVVSDDLKEGSAGGLGVHGFRKDLFLHGPVVVPESMISQLQYIIYATNLISIHGDDYVSSVNTPKEDMDLLKLIYLIDFTESRYGQYAQVQKRGYIDQRAWMTRLWSITHTANLVEDLGISLTEGSMDVISEVKSLRKDWLDGGDISDDRFVKVFLDSEAVLTDVFKKACDLAYDKLGVSQLPGGSEIVIGNKRVRCSPEEPSIRGGWARVPRTCQYVTTYANVLYSVYLRKYGFDILDESYDKPVTAMSQLMGTRAEIVRRLNSFHVSKGINFSMGGYLGLPLSEHRWIDEVKFKLGWMIGHVL